VEKAEAGRGLQGKGSLRSELEMLAESVVLKNTGRQSENNSWSVMDLYSKQLDTQRRTP
jgi:hypothetical protein